MARATPEELHTLPTLFVDLFGKSLCPHPVHQGCHLDNSATNLVFPGECMG